MVMIGRRKKTFLNFGMALRPKGGGLVSFEQTSHPNSSWMYFAVLE